MTSISPSNTAPPSRPQTHTHTQTHQVGDVVETVRPEKKSAQYQDVIKKGDTLLTNIQKLARSLDV